MIDKKPRRLAKPMEWMRRYGPAEVLGTSTAYGGFFLAKALTDNDIVSAYIGAISENIGFYGTMITREVIEDMRKVRVNGERYKTSNMLKLAGKLFSEFGPAEVLDSAIVRPLAMGFGARYLGNGIGIFAGKLAADVCFYAPAIASCEIRKRIKKDE